MIELITDLHLHGEFEMPDLVTTITSIYYRYNDTII